MGLQKIRSLIQLILAVCLLFNAVLFPAKLYAGDAKYAIPNAGDKIYSIPTKPASAFEKKLVQGSAVLSDDSSVKPHSAASLKINVSDGAKGFIQSAGFDITADQKGQIAKYGFRLIALALRFF